MCFWRAKKLKVGLELPAPFDFSKILGHDAIPWIPGIPSSLFYFSRSSHRFHLHGLLFPCFHINPSNPVEIMTTLSKVVLSKVNKTKLVSFIEDEKKKPLFLDDSSEGVDDFTSWKYFQQHPLRLKMKGHSSAWAPGFVEKVKHQRFFEMDAPLVVRTRKTAEEFAKEQEELKRRAKMQLQLWMEGGGEDETLKKKKKGKHKAALFTQKKQNKGHSDSESDAEQSGGSDLDDPNRSGKSVDHKKRKEKKEQKIARKKETLEGILSSSLA